MESNNQIRNKLSSEEDPLQLSGNVPKHKRNPVIDFLDTVGAVLLLVMALPSYLLYLICARIFGLGPTFNPDPSDVVWQRLIGIIGGLLTLFMIHEIVLWFFGVD